MGAGGQAQERVGGAGEPVPAAPSPGLGSGVPRARAAGGSPGVEPGARRAVPRPHTPLLFAWQVNMVIGILVFNKLVSKDGITDKKLKERAG